jgi:hypothetical protein
VMDLSGGAVRPNPRSRLPIHSALSPPTVMGNMTADAHTGVVDTSTTKAVVLD